MKKTNLCNLVANDIVHYGMESTMNFSYNVCLDEYLEEFDDESKKYILNNVENINNSIKHNENIASLDYDENKHEVDMVFYLDGLFDRVEKMVYNSAEILKEDLEVDEVRTIAEDVIADINKTDLIMNKVKSYKGYQADI